VIGEKGSDISSPIGSIKKERLKMAEKLEYALMKKGDEKVAVDKSLINDHELLGWNVVGICEVDSDDVVTETGKVIGTPAHTIVTTDGFLKVLPVQVDNPAPVAAVGPVIKVEPAKVVKVVKIAKVVKPAPKVELVVKPADKPK
jgi:hypothetical protein